MCGIWAFVSNQRGDGPSKDEIESWQRAIEKLRARGPDCTREWNICLEGLEVHLGFTRLAINGVGAAGDQPFTRGGAAWICNGEIYNTRVLEEAVGVESASGSDCEVLGELYKHVGGDLAAFARALDGVFALVYVDMEKEEVVVARDPYGVRPLYVANTGAGWYFASERKGLECVVGVGAIEEFPPGVIRRYGAGEVVEAVKYHEVPWVKQVAYSDPVNAMTAVRDALVAAVRKRMMTERPVAALLSGGLDSSLIAALVQRELKVAGVGPLKTFSIGMKGSSDLAYARRVADWIHSDHTEIVVTADEMFTSIPHVIHDIESYDITTVRASVGNWMVSREIARRTDCKVIFNGDGSDEVFGSYLYMKNAPNSLVYEAEVHRLLREIHQYDVLRSDRSISSHGLEARTPFLDKQFVATVMACPLWMRRPAEGVIEKWLLRSAFDGLDLLPKEVLWRRKEAFSDGVSGEERPWYQEIQMRVRAGGVVEDGWQMTACQMTPEPKTEEAYYYRKLFDELYTHTGTRWPYWMPRWSPETTDPSATTLGVYGVSAAAQ